MKSLIISTCLLAGSFMWAQDVEDSMDNLPLIDQSSSSVAYNVRGVYQIKDNNCDPAKFQTLKYPGGTDAYIKELKEKLQQNVDWSSYAVNGLFFIKMDINKAGVLSNLEAGPNVANSEPFLKDLKDTVKKVNKTWIPAKCNGIAADSKAIIKIDFSSMTFDADSE